MSGYRIFSWLCLSRKYPSINLREAEGRLNSLWIMGGVQIISSFMGTRFIHSFLKLFIKKQQYLKGGSNFCQVTIVSLSVAILYNDDHTHHLLYMALFIFRTFEAFYQNLHTSLEGTAAYNILDITPYFGKVSRDFIY